MKGLFKIEQSEEKILCVKNGGIIIGLEITFFTIRENIIIMTSKYNTRWGVICGKYNWDYNGKRIENLDIVKSVAFDLFDVNLVLSHTKSESYTVGHYRMKNELGEE